LQHLHAVDVGRDHVSNHTGLDHIPIRNSVSRTFSLF
jgi:hypothetical protein